MTAQGPLAHLEPRSLWTHFDALRRIPRPSGSEAAAREYVRRWAVERGYDAREDAIGNIRVRVPATPGHESARPVILQGHLDIVPEKDPALTFDFMKDPIEVKVDGDWVVAEKTTLGADNGVGVAAALASADDASVVHGPLELLMTIDEERGLTGAAKVDSSMLEGRTLINLDSEDEGMLFVGCAGGCTTQIAFPVKRVQAPSGYVSVRIAVSGLIGGHSGITIHENRANAIKVAAHVLGAWMARSPVCVASLEAGNKDNAIPRDATVIAHVPATFVAEARTLAEKTRASLATEFSGIDPNLAIAVEPAEGTPSLPLDADRSRQLMLLLTGLPHGALVMSRDIAGMTETSTNLAVARTEVDKIRLTSSCRSSVASALRRTLDQVGAVARLAGAETNDMSGYPGWQPDMTSALLATCKAVHKDVCGKEARVTAIHAGLECGLIGERLGGKADMISYGPDIRGVHAPGERVSIPSVARFWSFHKAVLSKLARP
jgi:dipeptidase D